MKAIANQATGDDYAPSLTLEAKRFVRLVITVTGKSARYQLGTGYPPAYHSPELFLAPGAVYTLERECSGIRLKSGAKGNPAQVSVEAVEPWDVPA